MRNLELINAAVYLEQRSYLSFDTSTFHNRGVLSVSMYLSFLMTTAERRESNSDPSATVQLSHNRKLYIVLPLRRGGTRWDRSSWQL
ncbi:MAG TPA: hypothetical protein VIS48_14945 [Candidatus Kryptonia bacterium]